MEFVYHIYGLNVASTRRLPYLNCASSSSAVDVHITFVGNRSEQPSPDGFFCFRRLPDGSLVFWTCLDDGYAEYSISSDGCMIRVAHSEQIPILKAARYVTGLALGAALRFRGVLCLHAGAVAVNGSALVFAGPSGVGKSTLSAAFHQRGYSLISEEVVAVDNRNMYAQVQPGFAGIRLYPNTLELLYGPGAVMAATQIDEKYLHRLDAIPTSPYPVRALYLLAPRDPALNQPRVTRVDKPNALLALTSQFYLHRFGPKEWLARDFPRLGELVRRIPVYLLERPDSLSCLDATIDLILAQQAPAEPGGERQLLTE